MTKTGLRFFNKVLIFVVLRFMTKKTKKTTMTKIPNNWLLILFEILILEFGIYL